MTRRWHLLLLAATWLAATTAWADPQGKGNAPIVPPPDLPGSGKWTEQAATFPAPPREADLVEYHLNGKTEHRFYVDTRSVAVGDDGVIRFTLVIRTGGGGVSTRYAGMRCKTWEWKTYGSLAEGGAWQTYVEPEWHKIIPKRINDFENTLLRDFFCDGDAARGDARRLVSGLRRPEAPSWRQQTHQ